MSNKHTEVKRWPFVETPGEFTDRLAAAMREYPTLLAAVRFVLIEQPPTLALEAAQRLATQSAEEAQSQLRALTMEEITSACGNHERNMHVIWAVQAKFCEVNGLPQVIARESSQRLAAQPGEPVAWRWRCLLKPDYTKYGSWQLTKDPERARAHPGGYGDWPGFQCEPLYASHPPQQGEKEASGVAPAATEQDIAATRERVEGMRYARNLFSLCRTSEQVDQQLIKLSERINDHERDIAEAKRARNAGVIGIDPGAPEGDRSATVRLCPATPKPYYQRVPVRVLAGADPFCPKCGHNRDTSSVSSIDHGTHQACQLCGTAWRELPAGVLPSAGGHHGDMA